MNQIFLAKKNFIILCFPMIIIIGLSAVSSINAKLPSATEIFSKAMKSESTVDYVGRQIVIFWHHPRITAFEERVINQAPSTHLVELLMPKEMSPPHDKRRRRLPPPPPRKLQDIWETDTQLLLRNYTVDVAKGEPIAGQSTYLLQINPKFASRPKKKVWVDEQNYIILRMEEYDITEKLNSLAVYTTIDYDSASVARQIKRYREKQLKEEAVEGSVATSSTPDRPWLYQSEEVSFAEAEKQFGAKLQKPSNLPVGFQLQSISVVKFRGKRVHFRYTDGLTVLSLFVSKAGDEAGERRRRSVEGDRQGDRRDREDRFRRERPITVTVKDIPIFIDDRGYMRILQWKISQQKEQENLRFVLIGELRQDELLKMAESLISER